ncbi:MAG TPA: efflux transporter outer membrane subunit [Acidobacteriaceae bacterium]
MSHLLTPAQAVLSRQVAPCPGLLTAPRLTPQPRRRHASPAPFRLLWAELLAFALFALFALFTGCKVGPNYQRPVVQTPGAYRGGAAPDIAPQTTRESLGDRQWAAVFRDPVLQKLIEEALRNNYDVQIAARRVLEQEAQVGIARASQYPTLTAGASYDAIGIPSGLLSSLNSNNNNGSSGNGGNSNQKNTPSHYYSGGLTSSAAWNLDFWGQYRRQSEAARAQLLSTEWGRQTTRATVVMEVATGYLQLRALDAQLAITHDTIQAREQGLKLTQTLEEGGANSLADVRQAEELLYSARAEVPTLEQQIAQQENALSLLLGRSPGPIERGAPTNAVAIADQAHPQPVPAGLPSQLLERRPDVRAAEANLMQANAEIGVARAQFFPAVSLSGTGGTSSSQLKRLVDAGSAYWYIIGSVSQPIFEGGRLTNNLRYARAEQQEMLVTYQKTIAGALSDVSSALVAYGKTREYREEQEKETASAQDAVRLARMRYEGGYTSFLEVLTNDANLYTAQLALTTAQQQEAQSLVQLYNVLGGGWQ